MGKTKSRPMPEGKKFQKGFSGNPNGRPKLPGPVKAMRSMNADQIAEIGTVLLEGTVEDLKAIVQNPNTSIIKKWAATVIINGMKTGDMKAFDGILNRVVGRVEKKVMHDIERKTPIQQRVEAMTEEQQVQFVRDAAKDLEDILDAE